MRFWHAILVGLLMIGASTRADAALIITVYESGNNVLATATGSLTFTGLGPGTTAAATAVNPSSGFLVLGVPTGIAQSLIGYRGASGPISFGPGTTTRNATSFSGIQVGFGIVISGQKLILVDRDYTPGSPINSTAQWNNATITSIGLTPGQYLYTWSADSMTVNIVPEPSSFGLIALGSLALLYRLRQRS